jgi:hypothetical protein
MKGRCEVQPVEPPLRVSVVAMAGGNRTSSMFDVIHSCYDSLRLFHLACSSAVQSKPKVQFDRLQ